MQLSASAIQQILRTQYCKKLIEAKEEWRCDRGLMYRGMFDCICKIVSWETSMQDYVNPNQREMMNRCKAFRVLMNR